MTEAFADATGRTEEEFRLALLLVPAVGGVIAVLRLFNALEDLGFFVLRDSTK